MSLSRLCSRNACRNQAVATLTYVYADSTAVVGPLATYAEPHTYDLCGDHAQGLTAPRGWEIVRLSVDYAQPAPTHDDLLALADAVREAGRPRVAAPLAQAATAAAGAAALRQEDERAGVREVGRRRHLRVLTDRDT